MKNNSMIFALLGVSALLFVGCMKEQSINEQYRPAGSEILFGASTEYDNGEATRTEYDSAEPGTRTEYSGIIFDVYGSTPKSERINWLSGDNMKIFYQQGTSTASNGVYGVTTINPDREKSYADVVCTDGTKLTWGDGTGNHKFYAMYPAKGFGGNNDMDLTNTNHVTGFIPATQDINTSNTITVDNQLKYQPDMKYAYLVSYKEIAASSTATRAELPFSPAVTTFEFKFKLNQNDAQTTRTVTKFTMEASTNLTGNFALDITGWDNNKATWNNLTQSNGGKKITVNFPNGGYTMTKDAYLDFSVLALPVQQENVKITFYFKDGNVEYSKYVVINKNNAPATFAAAKKHIITNDSLTGEVITYHLDVTPTINVGYLGATTTYTVTSYKQVGSTGAKYKVKWSAVSYAVDGGTPTTTKPSWLPTFKQSDNAYSDPHDWAIKIAPADRVNPGISALSVTEKGTQDNPWDLSMHSINGGDLPGKTTANCYVVTGPGWYKFPVAYGNAYKNGSTNSDAYNHTPSGTQNSHYLKPFKDSNNNSINKADITGVNGVQLVWQDAQDLIDTEALQLTSADSQGRRYIVFYISGDTIREGNAVIAVKKGDAIFWSWHIWVTPYVSNNVTVKGKTYMARNLGWCEGGTTTWIPRSVVITFKQNEGNAGTKTLTITQTGNTETVLGSSPHYQWGRKDPMIPPIGLTSNSEEAANKIWYNASGVASQVVTTKPGPQDIGYSFLNPMTMIYDPRESLPRAQGGIGASGNGHWYSDWTGNSDSWESDNHYCNLWNYNVNVNGTNLTGIPITDYASLAHGKTVYDPCPIGYTIPTPYEIANMATFKESVYLNGYTLYNTNYGTWDNGSTMRGYIVDGNFWAANGMRMYLTDNIHVDSVGSMGYWFSSGPYNSHMIYTLLEYGSGKSTPGFTISGAYAKASARSIRCVPE